MIWLCGMTYPGIKKPGTSGMPASKLDPSTLTQVCSETEFRQNPTVWSLIVHCCSGKCICFAKDITRTDQNGCFVPMFARIPQNCNSNEVTDENPPGIWGYLIWIPGTKSAIWCRDRGFALFSCCLLKLWEICLLWSTRCERDFEPWLNGWFVFHVLASAFYDLHEENCIQSPCHMIWVPES